MFIATILTLLTTAPSAATTHAECKATLVPAGSVVAPNIDDVRRVWPRFLESEDRKATTKETSARVALRIEELSTLLKEAVDASDSSRRNELSGRLVTLIEEIRLDLGFDPKPTPAGAGPSSAAQMEKIKALVQEAERSHRHPRRVSGLVEELKSILADTPDGEAKEDEAGFKVIFESSRAQTQARDDASDACSSKPSNVKDFKRYFSEMYDLFDASGSAVPTEVLEALSTLGMRPRIVAQLLPSMVLDGTGSVLQPAAQVQWRTRNLKLGPLEWNTDGGVGYGPAVVVLDPAPVAKITQQETVITTIDASGQTRQTRTVTPSGSYTCDLSTRIVDGVSKEVCDPVKPGQPRLDLQNSFGWHLGLQVGGGLEAGGRAGEIRFFGKAQMTNPTASFRIAEDKRTEGTGSTALATIDGEALWAFESGVRIAIYDRDRQEPRERSGLRPAISLAYGLRWDKRLAATNVENAGANSERRQFLRVTLTKIPVFQDNGDVFNLTLGIDREWASSFGRGQNGLPGVTRLFIQANIDVLKAFGGKSQ